MSGIERTLSLDTLASLIKNKLDEEFRLDANGYKIPADEDDHNGALCDAKDAIEELFAELRGEQGRGRYAYVWRYAYVCWTVDGAVTGFVNSHGREVP